MKVVGAIPTIGTSILIINSVIKGNAMPPRNILGTYVELEGHIVRIRSLCVFLYWSDSIRTREKLSSKWMLCSIIIWLTHRTSRRNNRRSDEKNPVQCIVWQLCKSWKATNPV